MAESSAAADAKSLVSLRSIIRFITLIVTVLVWILIASVRYRGDAHNATLACAILLTLWLSFIVVLYVLKKCCLAQNKLLKIIELIGDVTLWAWNFITFAVNCSNWHDWCCSWGDKYKASVIFQAVSVSCLLVSIVLDILALKGDNEQSA